MHSLSGKYALALALMVGCGDDASMSALVEDGGTPGGGSAGMDAGARDGGPGLDAQVVVSHDASATPSADASSDGGDATGPGASIDAASKRSLHMVTYNVAGLPEGISSSMPTVDSALISPLLNAYQLALLQEDFSYHAQIISMVKQPYIAPVDTSGSSLGDGLSFLSDYPFSDFVRIPWDDCNGVLTDGSDCLTPKGFSFTRFQLAPGMAIDVYDVHADAGSSMGDQSARAKNLRQLSAAINERSKGRAVIVAGDTNARYSNPADNVGELVDSAGLVDVWVELVRSGTRPTAGVPVTCSATDENDPQCERLDKVFYRNAVEAGFDLRPTAYSVDGATFVDAMGAQLSDHRPVSASFQLTPR